MADVIHHGGCLCGAVRYEATGDPIRTVHCHCHSCRKALGAVVATFTCFPYSNFRYVKGKPKQYQSSDGVTRAFCGKCGTSLTYHGERWANEMHVLTATLDQPEDFPAKKEAYAAERIPWFKIDHA